MTAPGVTGAPVDVLAVMDAHAYGIAVAAKRARGEIREEMLAGHAEFVEARAAVAELIEDRRRLADALAKLVCEPGKPEYRDQARAALARCARSGS